MVESQNKLKSASHWNIVAVDLARQSCAKSSGLPVYIQKASTETTFSKVFSSQLKSGLLDSGCTLATSPLNAAEVSVAVDQVMHTNFSNQRFSPGELTALAAGVLVLRDVTNPISMRNAVDYSAATLLAIDGYSYIKDLNNPPDTEIVLTVSVKANDETIMHKTNIYYIDSSDAELFTASMGREYKIVGIKK
jgi:hypothetical protein